MKIQASTAAAVIFALLSVAFAAFIDVTSTEVTAVLLVMVVASFILGVIKPKGILIWAVMLGAGMVLTEIGARAAGFAPLGYLHGPGDVPGRAVPPWLGGILQALICFVFALLGGGLGAAARWAVGRVFNHSL